MKQHPLQDLFDSAHELDAITQRIKRQLTALEDARQIRDAHNSLSYSVEYVRQLEEILRTLRQENRKLTSLQAELTTCKEELTAYKHVLQVITSTLNGFKK